MMSDDKVTAELETRDVTGKKVAGLKKQKIVPGVIYGKGFKSINVQAPLADMEKLVRRAGKRTPVHVQVGKRRKITMIKDIDIDPVKHLIRHISFHAVRHNEKVHADIPVTLKDEGESDAEKAGLVILQSLDVINVKALPNDLPDEFSVSVAGLSEEGERLTVADLTIPPEAEIELEPETIIATVYEPSALQAANEETGGAAEPGDEEDVPAEEGGEDTGEGENVESNKGTDTTEKSS